MSETALALQLMEVRAVAAVLISELGKYHFQMEGLCHACWTNGGPWPCSTAQIVAKADARLKGATGDE